MKSILCIIAMSALLAMLVFLSGCYDEHRNYIPIRETIHLEGGGTVTHQYFVPNTPEWQENKRAIESTKK